MVPFFILMGSLVLLRAVGWLGVARLASWRECARSWSPTHAPMAARAHSARLHRPDLVELDL